MRWLRPAALGLGVVVAVAGCGGTSKSTRARSDAKAACVEMLSLGATVAQHTSVLSSDAYSALVYAHKEANEALSLDPKWEALAASVRSIGASFVSGKRGTLVADLDDLASACRPIVGASG